MGPTWVLSAADGPHVGSMNLVIRVHMESNISVNIDSGNNLHLLPCQEKVGKFESKYKNHIEPKCIWNRRQQNGGNLFRPQYVYQQWTHPYLALFRYLQNPVFQYFVSIRMMFELLQPYPLDTLQFGFRFDHLMSRYFLICVSYYVIHCSVRQN